MFSSNLYVLFAGHQTRVALPIKMTNVYLLDREMILLGDFNVDFNRAEYFH